MNTLNLTLTLLTAVFIFTQCSQNENEKSQAQSSIETTESNVNTNSYNGFNSLEEYGGHLVMIAGCHDCHTPKKMGPHGPELDMDLALSGHPSKMPAPDVNRKEMESKGFAVTQTLTAWVGPWGISYAANLTSDETGIGNWQEKNFIKAIREGKAKGMDNSRPILPPMPIEVLKHMTDQELKAIFAYLKSTKPIQNVVPAPEPPLTAMR